MQKWLRELLNWKNIILRKAKYNRDHEVAPVFDEKNVKNYFQNVLKEDAQYSYALMYSSNVS